MKGLEKLPSLTPIQMKIQADHYVIEDEIMMFLIANSNSVGGFEKIAPNARLNDGMFDILIIKKMSLPEFIRVATMALKGEHIHDPAVIYFQAKTLKATSPEKVVLNLDGEIGGKCPCTFTTLPRHIRLIL